MFYHRLAIMNKSSVGLLCFVTGMVGMALMYFPQEKNTHKNKRFDAIKKRSKLQSNYTIEFCVSDIASAISAIHGGATSLELCSNRLEGGVTPSLGFVEECVRLCRNLSVEVHVLIRPRPGGFVYDSEEFEVIMRDITSLVAAGVDGIVCGILTSDNQVDEVRMQAIRQATCSVKLTFHRAFDLCLSKHEALRSIIKLGCDRLLSSGQETNAVAGTENLKILQEQYGRYIRIIAAAGLTINNVENFVRESGIKGVHTGGGVDMLYIETHHYIDPDVFKDMMSWKGANIELVEKFVNNCMQGWGGCAPHLCESDSCQ